MRLHHPVFAVFAALALLLSACGPDASQDAERRPGAALVRSTAEGAWTEATRWRAAEDVVIGDHAGAEPLVYPLALEVDAAGRLYVLDAQAFRIHVFDGGGRHLRSFGRKGAGPGELAQPIGMAMAPDGLLWVADAGNMRFTAFDSAGTVRATHRRDGIAYIPWPGRFDREGRLWDVVQGPGGLGSPPALVRLDPRGGAPATFPLPEYRQAQWTVRSGSVVNSAVVPFSPALVWALDGDGRVWSGVSSGYRLALHDAGGDTLRVAEVPLPAVAVTRAERDTALGLLQGFVQQGGRVDASRIPRHKPAFSAIHVDDRGYLWIRPALPAGQPNAAFDVLEPGGRYLGRVALPAPVMEGMPVRIHGDRLYTVLLSDDFIPRIVRYRIQGRGGTDGQVASR